MQWMPRKKKDDKNHDTTWSSSYKNVMKYKSCLWKQLLERNFKKFQFTSETSLSLSVTDSIDHKSDKFSDINTL